MHVDNLSAGFAQGAHCPAGGTRCRAGGGGSGVGPANTGGSPGQEGSQWSVPSREIHPITPTKTL